MTQPRLVTDEVKAMIGREAQPWTAPEPVDRGAIRRLAEALMDENPLYTDEEYAKKTRYGGIIAPPTFAIRPPWGTWEMKGPSEWIPAVDVPGTRRTVNAGNELEFFRPVRPGDTLSHRTRVADIYERQGRSGPMAIATVETVVSNQRGQVVALFKQTFLKMT